MDPTLFVILGFITGALITLASVLAARHNAREWAKMYADRERYLDEREARREARER